MEGLYQEESHKTVEGIDPAYLIAYLNESARRLKDIDKRTEEMKRVSGYVLRLEFTV